MAKILTTLKFPFEMQKPIICQEEKTTLYADFYSEPLKIIIETDGSYWHQDKEKDDKRDALILKTLGTDWEIAHLDENEVYAIAKNMGLK
jgi:very-short-patch-repair endonuclease